MIEHHKRCRNESVDLLANKVFVKPYGYESVGQYNSSKIHVSDFFKSLFDYTNELFFHSLMTAFYLDDNKLGRLFRDVFGKTIPPPAIALFATTVSR